MWWLLSAGLTGGLSPVYHRIDRAKRSTACGIQLPEVFGMFSALADDAKAQRDKRCAACVTALKTRRAP
jgi:hypothetical protein